MTIELPWATKTLFPSMLTITTKMIMGSLCLGTTPSMSELEKMMSGIGSSLRVFFISSVNKLKIS